MHVDAPQPAHLKYAPRKGIQPCKKKVLVEKTNSLQPAVVWKQYNAKCPEDFRTFCTLVAEENISFNRFYGNSTIVCADYNYTDELLWRNYQILKNEISADERYIHLIHGWPDNIPIFVGFTNKWYTSSTCITSGLTRTEIRFKAAGYQT